MLSRALIHLPACSTIACLYVYDCMCVIVWQCENDVMMANTRSYTVSNSVSSNMIAFVSIHVGWDNWWGSGGFRCRYLVRFRRFPLQIPVGVLQGSGADTCWGSWLWFCYHCAAPLQACMCMIVWQCAHDVIVKITWLLELVTTCNWTWLMWKNETQHKLSNCLG